MSEPNPQLRAALLEYSAGLRAQHTPPPAAAIWLAAERRNRRLALARAARPLWIMQMVAAIAGLLACGWAACVGGWSFAGPRMAGPLTAGPWTTGPWTTGPWTTWGALAALLVAAGCWTMWRAARSLSV